MVVSTYVLGKILEKVFNNRIEEIEIVYNALRVILTTAGATGMTYKCQVHYLLQEEGVINFLPIRYDPVDRGTDAIYKDYSATDSANIRVALPKSKELCFDEPLPPSLKSVPTTALEAPTAPRSTHSFLSNPLLGGPHPPRISDNNQ